MQKVASLLIVCHVDVDVVAVFFCLRGRLYLILDYSWNIVKSYSHTDHAVYTLLVLELRKGLFHRFEPLNDALPAGRHMHANFVLQKCAWAKLEV